MKKRKITQEDFEQAAFEALIEKYEGRISPRILVDESRDPRAPLHHKFTWDDEEAGENYRLVQAGQLIRTWRGSLLRIDREANLIRVETQRRVQSPLSQRGKDKDSYSTIEEIMSNPITREEMLQTVLRELSAYRKRYAQLLALANVWAAVDEALELLTQQKSQAGKQEGDRPGI